MWVCINSDKRCQICIQYANWTQYNGHAIRKFKPKLSMRVNHSFVVFAGFSWAEGGDFLSGFPRIFYQENLWVGYTRAIVCPRSLGPFCIVWKYVSQNKFKAIQIYICFKFYKLNVVFIIEKCSLNVSKGIYMIKTRTIYISGRASRWRR